jgi:MerR family transcriptional regulator/heat shock protein HspR
MSASQVPSRIDRDAPVFVISVAASLAGMHPQTLRTYDRMGLVSPRRSAGRGRRYSARDIASLRLIQRLSQDEGINLEGIRRILSLQDEIEELRARVEDLSEMLAVARATPQGGVRVFTADPNGAVHVAGERRRSARRAITAR